MWSTNSPWAGVLFGAALIALGAALVKYRERYAAFWGRIFGPKVIERSGGSDRHQVAGWFLVAIGAVAVLASISRLF
jgi:hypothetical protein